MCGFQGRGAFIRQGAFVREGRLIQTCQLRGALIRYEAFIREGAFIRSFTVYLNQALNRSLKPSPFNCPFSL